MAACEVGVLQAKRERRAVTQRESVPEELGIGIAHDLAVRLTPGMLNVSAVRQS